MPAKKKAFSAKAPATRSKSGGGLDFTALVAVTSVG